MVFGTNQNSLFHIGTPAARCGCYFANNHQWGRLYLPQVEVVIHTTILGNTSSTKLRQTFLNTANHHIESSQYTFPLYDGVSIGDFRCTIGDRVITGIVKERQQARQEFEAAVQSGQNAGLLEQNLDAGDVFTTSVGNVAAGESVVVEITYLGEMKNDAENDGARFTIPMAIAPRFGSATDDLHHAPETAVKGLTITVDVKLEPGRIVRNLHSQSHPVSVTMGQLSGTGIHDDSFESNLASMTISLKEAQLTNDFILLVQSKEQGTPKALLETHPVVRDSRVVMTTLVPRFNLPAAYPEIVFLIDRSGSMGARMRLVQDAMKTFLKSIPVGIKFNIYSFGSTFSSLFKKSSNYDARSVQIAMDHLLPAKFTANYGGTEMLEPTKALLKNRFPDLPLEVILLTDGQINNQTELFDVVNEAATRNARFFTLGIGSGASSSLVEGIARAGRGFSQWVIDSERMDKKLINMLRGALTPHTNYKVQVKYAASTPSEADDFVLIDSFENSTLTAGQQVTCSTEEMEKKRTKVSLFASEVKDEALPEQADPYSNLPTFDVPNILQVPNELPELYTHSRITVYLILGPGTQKRTPTSILLLGKSGEHDLELEIHIQDIGKGDTLHKLAAKRAMQDLEEGRGWLTSVRDSDGRYLRDLHPGKWDMVVQREAVRLGTTYQVAGKHCSFVAISADGQFETAQHSSDPTLKDFQSESIVLRQDNRKRRTMAPAGGGWGAPAASGFTFGSQQAGSLFAPRTSVDARGGTATYQGSGSLFGTAQPNKRTSTGTSGLFSTGGLFGGTPQQSSSFGAAAGGMFGSSVNVRPSQSASGSFFGALPQQQQQQQAHMLAQGNIFAKQPDSVSGTAFGSAAPVPPTPSSSENGSVRKRAPFGAMACRKMDIAKPEPRITRNASRQSSRGEDSGYMLRSSAAFGCSQFTVQDPANHDALQASNTYPTTVDPSISANVHLPVRESMQQLIDLQSFAGSWTPSLALFVALKCRAKLFTQIATTQDICDLVKDQARRSKIGQNISLPQDAAATICALAWLETVAKDEEDVWAMIADKARGWLMTNGAILNSDTASRLITAVGQAWHTP